MNGDISYSVRRGDVPDKICGRAQYMPDIKFEGCLYAKTLRSTKPRARILSIDIPDLPEGYYIVDKNDIPGKNKVKIIIYDQPFFAEDVVNYIGEPILLVVGQDKNKILEIVSQIKVNYEELSPIFDVDMGVSSEISPIFGDNNLFADYNYSKGTMEAAQRDAVKIFEKEYKTGYQEQLYLETQGVAAVYEDGKMNVYGSIQCPYYVKDAVVQGLGFESDRVRIVQTVTGGAFGGKEEFPSIIAGQVAFAALKTGKPVVLIYDRDEDIEFTTKRHPSVIKLKSYVDSNNRIIGMESDIRLDAGAYCGMSTIVLQRSIFAAIGCYDVENIKVRGRAVATNNIVSGAFRGFGAPQSFFALEMHMDYMAQELSLDPLDFRKANLVKTGDSSSTGGTFRDYVPLQEIIQKAEEMSDYKRKVEEFKNSDKLRGIGFSVFFHGGGFTGNGERDIIKAKVKLRKYSDNKVEILISNVEMGQGTHTTLRKIVAETLEIPFEDVIVKNPDTDRVPNSGPTVASRTTMIIGKLLQDAAEEMKKRWNEKEFDTEADYKHPEGYEWDAVKFIGDAYNTYSWGANVVEVEVDKVTYEVNVKGVWTVYDVGKSMDDRIMKGQIEGGVLQGLGHAGMEVMDIKNGKLLQRTNTDYVIPTAVDFPEIKSALVDNPYKDGPYGAKSAGELTLIGAPPAYALAVQHATGKLINKIPVTPEYLMEVMQNGR